MKPFWGLILLGLVALLVAMEILSTRAMKKLGIEPSPVASWLRAANLTAVVVVIGFALYVIFK